MTSRFATPDNVTIPHVSREHASRETWVYIVTTDSLDSGDISLFTGWLDADETKRRARFTAASAEELFVAAHGAARFALSHWQKMHFPDAEVAPGEWSFRIGEFGKPEAYVADRDGIPLPSFSLSHTRGAAAVAITCGGRIGVDIECLERRVKPVEVAERYFATEEREDILARTDPDDSRHRFLLYWTLKEAYLKALGFGLTKPLKSFAFQPVAGGAQLLYDSDVQESDWAFWHYQRPEGYVLSLAWEVGTEGGYDGRIIVL